MPVADHFKKLKTFFWVAGGGFVFPLVLFHLMWRETDSVVERMVCMFIALIPVALIVAQDERRKEPAPINKRGIKTC